MEYNEIRRCYLAKSKTSSINGFLSVEDGILTHTKYKEQEENHGKVLYTKSEVKMNRFINNIIGKLKPEEEQFSAKLEEITDLNIIKYDPVVAGGNTYYTAQATFNSNGVEYSMTYAAKSAEDMDKLGEMFGK